MKLDRFSSPELLPYQKVELLLEIVASIEALYAQDVIDAAARRGVLPEQAIHEHPLCADDLLGVFTHLVIHATEVCQTLVPISRLCFASPLLIQLDHVVVMGPILPSFT